MGKKNRKRERGRKKLGNIFDNLLVAHEQKHSCIIARREELAERLREIFYSVKSKSLRDGAVMAFNLCLGSLTRTNTVEEVEKKKAIAVIDSAFTELMTKGQEKENVAG